MNIQEIALLCGGPSKEHLVSLRSALEIFEALKKTELTVDIVGIDQEGKWHLLTEEELADHVHTERPLAFEKEQSFAQTAMTLTYLKMHTEVVFPITHGFFGEDGGVQGVLEMLHIPYVGPRVLSSAICMDKAISKLVVSKKGVKTARYADVSRDDLETIHEFVEGFSYPLFIKPARTGSSLGVTRIEKKEELYNKVHETLFLDSKVVIEEHVKGREIEVAVIGNTHPEASLPGEVVPKDVFYTYDNKVNDGATLHVPAAVTKKEQKALQETAITCYKALECEGMARIDLFLQDDGTVVFNEANTLPGFTKTSLYPRLFEASGKTKTALIKKLLELAVETYRKHKEIELNDQLLNPKP